MFSLNFSSKISLNPTKGGGWVNLTSTAGKITWTVIRTHYGVIFCAQIFKRNGLGNKIDPRPRAGFAATTFSKSCQNPPLYFHPEGVIQCKMYFKVFFVLQLIHQQRKIRQDTSFRSISEASKNASKNGIFFHTNHEKVGKWNIRAGDWIFQTFLAETY